MALQLSFRRALWLGPVAMTLHNLEEGVWLPGWSPHAEGFLQPVGAAAFRFAVVVLTVAAWVLTAMAVRRGGRWIPLAAGMAVTMLLNLVVPHLAATVMMRSYAPGLATAVLLNAPANGYLLHRGLREGALTWKAIGIGALVVVPIVFVSIPLLFLLGRVVAGA